MSLRNLLSRVIRRPLSSWRGPQRRLSCGRPSSRLLLESLEKRWCLSTWSNIGPYGSPTHAIAIDPTNPDTIYTGSEGAGVRLSTDGGITWSARNTGLQGNALVVFSLVLDPRQPQTLYAVTFAGTYKSTDAGAHWRQTFGGVSQLAMDPTNSNTLYAGNTDGFLKSTDGGATWHGAGNGPVGVVYSISVDPLHPDTIYVGTQGTSASSIVGQGVFKTTDGGGHWSKVLASTSGVSVTLDPGAPQIVYAGNADGVFKSYDGGDTCSASRFQPRRHRVPGR
jgi:photosystem II stability/assembly factor-like uncharacterized protein